MIVRGTAENFEDLVGDTTLFVLGDPSDEAAVDFTNHGDLTLNSSTAFETADGPATVNIVNNGDISANGTDSIAFDVNRSGVTAVNNGTIVYEADANYGYGFYLTQNAWGSQVTNAGTLEIRDDDAIGVYIGQLSEWAEGTEALVFENSGTIRIANAPGSDAAVISGHHGPEDALVFRNSGLIDVTANDINSDAIVVLETSATIENSGTIRTTNTAGIIVYGTGVEGGDNLHIVNTGTMVSSGTGVSTLELTAAAFSRVGAAVTTIDNSGTISSNGRGGSSFAIYSGVPSANSQYSSGFVQITNNEGGLISSTSTGTISIYNGRITNAGTITGNSGLAPVVTVSLSSLFTNTSTGLVEAGANSAGAIYFEIGGTVTNRNGGIITSASTRMQDDGRGVAAVTSVNVNNFGTISAVDVAVRGDNYLFNYGTINGDVIFGSWDGEIDMSEGVFNGTAYLGAGNDTYLGTAGMNRVYGEDGDDELITGNSDDFLEGGAGADTLIGGGGVDTASYSRSSAGVTVNLLTGNHSGGDAAGDTLTGIENLTGSAFADSLTGDDGDNILEGGAGADILNGGDGNDTISYAQSASAVTVNLAIGTASGGDAEGDSFSSIENVIGSAFDDMLTDGGEGSLLSGGLGNDTYYINSRGAQIYEGGGAGTDTMIASVNAALADGVEILRLTGGARWGYGNIGDNSLVGTAGNDHLFGYAGDDRLQGGAGADTMTGGLGNDIYYVDNRRDQVIEAAGEGTDTLVSSINIVLGANVEELILRDDARWGYGNSLDNRITGTAGSDHLFGYAGDDRLQGGAGADWMTGGIGDDTYFVDNRRDQVIEAAGEGTDTIVTGINFALADNVENLTLAGSARWGYGNSLDNTLTGTAGDDHLYGYAGIDILTGGAGADWMAGGADNDTYYVDNRRDRVIEAVGEGSDAVIASVNYVLADNVESLTLTGNAHWGYGNSLDNTIGGGAGNDTLFGMAGNDTLIGEAGADTLTGGSGLDLFIYSAVTDSALGFGVDTITDFDVTGDRIDLMGIDADTTTEGDQAFTFLGATNFTGTAGELISAGQNGDTWLYGDTDGDRIADFRLRLTGSVQIDAGNLIL